MRHLIPVPQTLHEHREDLEKALAYDLDHTWSDLQLMLARGQAKAFFGDNSVLIVVINAKANELVMWLAAGDKDECLQLSKTAELWGKAMGCKRAHIVGRRGWVRELRGEGWDYHTAHLTKEM